MFRLRGRRLIFAALFFLLALPFQVIAQNLDSRAEDESIEGAVDSREDFDFSKVKTVAIIPIEGMIDEVADAFIERAVKEAQERNADLIVFEMHTHGGRVDSAQNICRHINSFDPLPSVIFVKQSAISAGALISIANNYIFMEPEATIGDAQPVIGNEPSEEEKYVSFVRTEFKAQATANGYNPYIAQAMVDQSIVLWEVEIAGDKRVVDALKLEEIEGNNANNVGLEIRSRKYKEEGKLLVLTAQDAVEVGFCHGIVQDRQGVYDVLGIQNPEEFRIEMTWSETFAKWLTSPILTGLLMMIGMMGLYMEFQQPGVGLPGGMAVACFAIMFFGKYVAGLAGVFELALLLIGLTLLIVELFVLPGFGIAGFGGIVCISAALVFSLQHFTLPSNPVESVVFSSNMTLFSIVLLASIVGIMVLIRLLPRTPMLSRTMLFANLSEEAGFVGVADYSRLLHQQGVAETELRPAGKVRIGEDLVDAVTRGNFIDIGQAIEVHKVESNRVIVVEVKA